jgi:asparagine synthase (glutamine-hydrolysing)
MSAIFGIIRKGQQPIQPHWTETLRAGLSHRGPDGAHTWQDEHATLGHLMLHTTPESCFDRQPLEYKHWVITADVRLDNRKELFAHLGISPSLQSQTTDSLLIAKAFEKWENRCPEFLVGDFAFAIWDKQQRTLFCAKDHTGIRQFFYYESPQFLVFATEMRALIRVDFISPELDLDIFANLLIGIYHIGGHASYTYIKGVRRLMPAHWLLWENQRLSTSLYWKRNPEHTVRFKDEREYGLALREHINTAIGDRMRTNFPIGMRLSGGLDSSSIASIAAPRLASQGKNLYTASSVLPANYKGIEEDERAYIELILARHKNIIPSFVSAEGIGAFDGLEDIYDKTCEPVNSLYYMDEALNQSLAPHTRVVLTGLIGDFTVSNPGRYCISTLLKQGRISTAARLLQSRKKTAGHPYKSLLLTHVLAPLVPYELKQVLKKISGKANSDPFQMLNTPASTSFVSENKARAMHRGMINEFYGSNTHEKSIWNTSFVVFLSQDDVLASYHRQEHAHPFTDKRIIEFLWASPPECFDYRGWPRGYIRRAMEDSPLPQEILWRKDKTMYSPDFQRRIRDESHQLAIFLEKEMTPQNSLFLNMPHILDTLEKIQPAQNWNSVDDRAHGVVHTGIQAIKYRKWLSEINQNNYF